MDPTTSRVYVANTNTSTVSVMDGDTNAVVATVPVGSRPIPLAVNPATNRVYVANAAGNTVSVIDGGSNTVTATIDFASGPAGIALNPLTSRLYVITTGFRGVLSVIDGATNSLFATLPSGSNSAQVAVDPDTGRVYVTNTMIGNVSIIDGGSNTVVTTVQVSKAVPTGTLGIAVNPTRNRAYVASFGLGADSFSIFDGATNTFLDSVPVAGGLGGIAVNPKTGRIYAANPKANTLSVIEDVTQPGRLPQTGEPAPVLPVVAGLGVLLLALGMASGRAT